MEEEKREARMVCLIILSLVHLIILLYNMLVKINDYTSSKFYFLTGNKSLLYDTKNGILYFRNNSNSLQELPDQNRNLVKLKKLLDNYRFDSDYELNVKERNIIKPIQKQINMSRKKRAAKNKSKKNTFFGF